MCVHEPHARKPLWPASQPLAPFPPPAQTNDLSEKAKGSFDLTTGTTITVQSGQDGFVINQGKNMLPLRHSIAEHQKAWIESIQKAIDGKLEPGPEDEAAINMGAPSPPFHPPLHRCLRTNASSR